MSLKCTNIDAGLRIHTDGTYSPCCLTRGVKYKDRKGEDMNVKTHTFEEAFSSPTLDEIRNAFKNNTKHPACETCWQEEALGRASKRVRDNQKTISDQVIHNTPFSLELNLGNICNLACRMCSLGASMNWKKEHNLTLGPDEQWSKEQINQIAKTYNNAFTDDSLIWEQLHSNMKYVRHLDMYGGEPLMMKKQWDALRYSVEQGYAKNQYIHFNTNGTIFKSEYVDILKHFKQADISFSIDGTHKYFEYIRYPAKWNETENIMETWLENTKEFHNIHYDLCFTYQILNVLNYGAVAEWCKDRNIRIYRNGVYAPHYYNATNIRESLKPAIIEKIRATPVRYPEIREEWEDIIGHINFKEADPVQWQKFLTVNNNLDISRNQSFVDLFPEEVKLFKYKLI